MTLKQIASLGTELSKFLWLFRSCFRSKAGFALVRIYLQGLRADLERKNVEGDWTTTKCGLKYEDIKVGKGKVAARGDSVRVHYTGTLTNCSVSDRLSE